ncbi:conserved protein of unknown function [Rhodovastum atsumiense]|uniref:DUF4340 domain-containing protein n=1 Tax=Rhodovastum atsumiense TaxID=504468 RepID=A0A5M6IM40_9PROT|nr:DUF4340 domain-containing protein [Rhodovastum atsumiense]KAA5609306.1 DUF4340 domain-containing protein [Rhodovastum atsumiense]CAH2604623.1 conserved protein of unknown function [Rhodovastum atsumiense]
MNPRIVAILGGVAVVVLGAALIWGRGPIAVTQTAPTQAGTLVFPGLAGRLQQAARVELTTKGQPLVITKQGDVWGLADRGNYPVQAGKLRELLTGLTELHLTEPRTADPAMYERLGVGDPASPTATATGLRVLDGSGQVLAELILGHRRVRAQANLPESIYVRRPNEARSWLAEGRLPVDADPQLWLLRDIANIDAKQVASVVVHRDDAVLRFGRDGDKPVLAEPADHPKLDDYRVEDVFRGLEQLTLTDVKPAAQQPGEKLGTATITLTDGTVVDATVFRADKDIWVQFAARGDSAQAKELAARVTGWTYQIGSWKERSLVPTLTELKAEEPQKPAAPEAAAPTETPVPQAAPASPAGTAAPDAAAPAGDTPAPEAEPEQKAE